MSTESVRLDEETRRGLHRTFGKVRVRTEPVHVEIPKGAPPLDGPNEVLVLILGPEGGIALLKKLRQPINLRELELRLAGAEVAVEKLGRQPLAQAPPLTMTEAELLDKAGLVEGTRDAVSAFEKSRIEFEMLVNESFTAERAAKLLGVNASRLRQRLTSEHTLYGIKEGRTWRVPVFQLDLKRKKLVRGIEKVIPRIRADAHPLAVAHWFQTPHQDLVVGDGEKETSITPLEWLASGQSVETVAELAEEI